MRRHITLSIVAAVALALVPAAQARCPRRGVHYLARTSHAIVFTLRGPHGIATYACRSRRSRPIRLDHVPGGPALAPSTLRIVGHYILYKTRYDTGDNGLEEVLRVDLDRAPAMVTTSTFGGIDTPTFPGDRLITPRGVVGSFLGGYSLQPLGGTIDFKAVLRDDGAFAWAASYVVPYVPAGQPNVTTQIWEQHRGAARLLDQGTSVQQGVIGLSSDRRSVTWVDNGQARSAPLS